MFGPVIILLVQCVLDGCLLRATFLHFAGAKDEAKLIDQSMDAVKECESHRNKIIVLEFGVFLLCRRAFAVESADIEFNSGEQIFESAASSR